MIFEKIMVMGVSAGAGKSTFAKELGEILNINVCHLDALFWEPGWIQTTTDQFKEAQRKFIHTSNEWIMEGNYTNTYDVRARNADTIIYLDLPLYVCLYRESGGYNIGGGHVRI